MALTKNQIVEKICNQLKYSKKDSFELIETLLELIKANLEKGEDLLISGFGKICVKEKKERLGRNPATGDAMTLSPRRVVTFNCSKRLRELVNQ